MLTLLQAEREASKIVQKCELIQPDPPPSYPTNVYSLFIARECTYEEKNPGVSSIPAVTTTILTFGSSPHETCQGSP